MLWRRIVAGTVLLSVPVVLAGQPMAGGVCRPASERKGEIGCWILRHERYSPTDSLVWWYLDAFADSAAAARAATPGATILQALGRGWRLTIADSRGPSPAGERVARVGPLRVDRGTTYMAQYMEAIFTPGMQAPVHFHAGTEAIVTLAGETCMETPTWVKVGRADTPPIIAPPRTAMHVSAIGATTRRSLVLILHDAAQAAAIPTDTWQSERRCSAAPPPPLPELRFASVQHRDHFAGDRWSYIEAGRPDATPIVLLHGIGDNAMSWRWQYEALADSFRVIGWNAPGYMLSDGLASDAPGCRAYADALADFLDALQLTRVGLLANSFGSRTAQCFALHHPGRVTRMMLVGPSAGRERLTAVERDSIVGFRRAQIANGGYHFAGRRATALVAAGTHDSLLAVQSRLMQATNPRGFMQAVALLTDTSYSPAELHRRVSSIPVLLVVGREDRVSPLESNGALLHAALPGSRLEVLHGVGHLPQIEAPTFVNRMARQFFGVTSAR